MDNDSSLSSLLHSTLLYNSFCFRSKITFKITTLRNKRRKEHLRWKVKKSPIFQGYFLNGVGFLLYFMNYLLIFFVFAFVFRFVCLRNDFLMLLLGSFGRYGLWPKSFFFLFIVFGLCVNISSISHDKMGILRCYFILLKLCTACLDISSRVEEHVRPRLLVIL